MKNLSLQAKDIILHLFFQGFTSIEIRFMMEDFEYLRIHRISDEIAKEIHHFIIKGKQQNEH